MTPEERNVLAHVVIDPDDWVAHALETVGESAIVAKIERWKPEYLAQKDLPDYKTRAERQAIEDAVLEPTEEQLYEAAIKAKEAEILRRQAVAELEAEK